MIKFRGIYKCVRCDTVVYGDFQVQDLSNSGNSPKNLLEHIDHICRTYNTTDGSSKSHGIMNLIGYDTVEVKS